jgi:tubulin-specific chaperone D
MDDFSVDRRGDVGSWVRQCAMLALTELLPLLAAALQKTDDGALSESLYEELCYELLCKTLREANSKLDNLRDKAGLALKTLLYSSSG